MSTTHIIFDAPSPPSYTVVGGRERRGESGLSAVLLNRGSRYPRKLIFSELENAGFDFVISIEAVEEHYDLDELSNLFPFVRFILLSAQTNIGTQINIAARETRTPLFFVLWNDLKILYGGTAAKISERLLTPPEQFANSLDSNAKKRWYKRICTVPVFQNASFETLPTAANPVLLKNKFNAMPFSPGKEAAPSLYPYDAVGIYDKQAFLDIGGFDENIKSEHWQLLDFGFRSWLWGEEICCTQLVRLRYEGFKKIEDTTYDESYWRFFLKNLSPVLRFNNDTKTLYAHLPLKKLISFLFKTAHYPALQYFLEVRKWVQKHKFNWKKSAKALIHEWEIK